MFVATLAILFNISGSELILDRDLDTNEELRDAGVLNVVSGALGGIPGYHALIADRARGAHERRRAGRGARSPRAVPLAAVVFGASVVGLIPRMIVGGVLVFLGLAFMVEWVWDKRRSLPPIEYGVVLVILAGSSPGGSAGRRGRARARGGPVRGQLRPGRARARGGVRRDLPQQRRSAGGRTRRAPHARGTRPDPARERVRVLRVDQRPARADPTARWKRPRRRGSW